MSSYSVPRFLRLWLLMPAMSVLAQTHIDLHYPQHDRTRPPPAVIDPGTASTQEAPGRPPSDAIVLFDGRDLSPWRSSPGVLTVELLQLFLQELR